MTSEDKANWYMSRFPNQDIGHLIGLLDNHAAEARAEQREKVAAWMIHNGYSTGHGDTMADLLEELEWQWDEALKKQREACAEAARNAGTIFGVEDAILNARTETGK